MRSRRFTSLTCPEPPKPEPYTFLGVSYRDQMEEAAKLLGRGLTTNERFGLLYGSGSISEVDGRNRNTPRKP